MLRAASNESEVSLGLNPEMDTSRVMQFVIAYSQTPRVCVDHSIERACSLAARMLRAASNALWRREVSLE